MNQKLLVPIAILLVVGMVFYMNIDSVPEGYQDFRAVEAEAKLAQNRDVTILDIRTPAEFKEGHISGAVNVDFRSSKFESELKKLDRDGRYFVYCRTGNRSGSAIKLMHRLGFTHVWHLADGIVDWKGAGLPVQN